MGTQGKEQVVVGIQLLVGVEEVQAQICGVVQDKVDSLVVGKDEELKGVVALVDCCYFVLFC